MTVTTAISNDIFPAFAHIIRNRTGMIFSLSFPLCCCVSSFLGVVLHDAVYCSGVSFRQWRAWYLSLHSVCGASFLVTSDVMFLSIVFDRIIAWCWVFSLIACETNSLSWQKFDVFQTNSKRMWCDKFPHCETQILSENLHWWGLKVLIPLRFCPFVLVLSSSFPDQDVSQWHSHAIK